MRLANKVSIITGASGGIGQCSAIRFAEEGSAVVLVDLNSGGLLETEALIKEANNKAEVLVIPMDVTSESAVKELFNKVINKFGKVDVLMNNAAIDGPNVEMENYPYEDYHKVLDVNIGGVFLGMKYAVKIMRKQGKGAIINMSSVAGVRGVLNMTAYAASKHAVIGLTKTAALEYSQYGVRINAIAPGVTKTPMAIKAASDAFPDNPEQFFENIGAKRPIRRVAEPMEMANVALFLASDEASYITGEVLSVDGGASSGASEW